MNNDIILSDEYYSIIFAAQKHGKLEGVYGEIHHIIPRCCCGRQKSAGGLHWKFYEGGDVDGR